MINIQNKADCTGCQACDNVCGHSAITFITDEEGFWYPKVDAAKCVDCHLCEKVCPVINQFEPRRPLKTYAAIYKDEAIRSKSSSGGIFTMLAASVIKEGGVVFGVRYGSDWQVTMDWTDTIEGLAAFRSSKYVQASVGQSYQQCKEFLKSGRIVLFSGTPCQVAGLRHFLNKDYENLFTVDVVCHGVPSPKVWGRYLREVLESKDIYHISMRDKENGWRQFNFAVEYEEGGKRVHLTSCFMDNDYMKAFMGNLTLRPSCYHCPVRSGKSQSDITLADYWGIEETNPEMFDDKGTSCVLIRTEKGRQLLQRFKDQVLYKETTYEKALCSNPSMEEDKIAHRNREQFFQQLDRSSNIVPLMRKMLAPSLNTIGYLLCHPIYTGKIVFSKVLRKVNRGGRNRGLSNPTVQATDSKASAGQYRIDNINFRSKNSGWKHYALDISLTAVGQN